MPEQAADAPPAKVFDYSLDPGHQKPPRVTTQGAAVRARTTSRRWSFLDSTGRERQEQEVSPASTADEPKTIVTDTRYDDAGHVAAESLPVVVPAAAGSALQAVPGDQVVETRHSLRRTRP